MNSIDPAGATASGSDGKPDPDEFAGFYNTYHERLISYLHGLGADQADADDLAAETFAQAASQWSRIRDRSWPWLSVVARNNYFRHNKSGSQHVYVDEIPELSQNDEDLAANTYARELLQEIRLLSPQQREIVGLRADGYSNAEIAERLDISESTVRSHIHRARARLKSPDMQVQSSVGQFIRSLQSHPVEPSKRTLVQEHWPDQSFVGRLPDAARTALLAAGTPVRFPDDHILLIQGDIGDFLYVLTGGFVKIIVTAESGTETTLGIRSRGELVGEESPIDGEPRIATARTAGEVTARQVSGTAFLAIGREFPVVQMALTRYLVANLRSSTERRAAERVWGARERLAQVLYSVAETFAGPDPGSEVRLPLTQSDLGDLAGVAVSTVERVLADFRREGIITSRYREIIIKDMANLRSLRFA